MKTDELRQEYKNYIDSMNKESKQSYEEYLETVVIEEKKIKNTLAICLVVAGTFLVFIALLPELFFN